MDHLKDSSSRGVEQGDPLSPSLFTMLLNLLLRMLVATETEGKLSRIKVSMSPRITQLCMLITLSSFAKLTTKRF